MKMRTTLFLLRDRAQFGERFRSPISPAGRFSGSIEPDVFRNGRRRSGHRDFETELAQHRADFLSFGPMWRRAKRLNLGFVATPVRCFFSPAMRSFTAALRLNRDALRILRRERLPLQGGALYGRSATSRLAETRTVTSRRYVNNACVGFDAVALAGARAVPRDARGCAFRRCKERCTAETSELAKARSCTTCLMLAPVDAICAARSARPPGPIADDGGETAEPAVGDQAALDHAAQDIRIDVAAAKEKDDAFAGQFWSCPERHAARGVAAAPSTTPFSSSTMRRIASAICSSVTVTV